MLNSFNMNSCIGTYGLLYWLIKANHVSKLSHQAANLQVTSFSIHSNGQSYRFISCPRLVNAFASNQLPPLLPNPSSCAHIAPTIDLLSAFSIDTKNIFHNVLISDHLSDLFYFPPISLLTLDADIRTYTSNSWNLNPNEDVILCPRHAKLSVGFTWSVLFAHHVMHAVFKKSTELHRGSSMSFQISRPLQLRNSATSPFTILKKPPLICNIIDENSVIMAGWPDDNVICLYQIIIVTLNSSQLAFCPKKIIPL